MPVDGGLGARLGDKLANAEFDVLYVEYELDKLADEIILYINRRDEIYKKRELALAAYRTTVAEVRAALEAARKEQHEGQGGTSPREG